MKFEPQFGFHKSFDVLTIDRILLDEEAERATRSELLARFVEHESTQGIFDDVYYYDFAKKYEVDKVLYENMLRDAVNAIQQLQYLHFQKEEILGLLSKEKLATWPKIVERIRRTKIGRDLIQQRRPKRVKRKTDWNYQKICKELFENLSAIPAWAKAASVGSE